MAYNVLKGIVEGSVDQYGDQEINGVKVFKNTISASVFYDTDAQSPCATLKDVPVRQLKGGTKHGLLTYQGNATAQTEYNLTFDGHELKTKDVRAERLFGSAIGLIDIPTAHFSGSLSASDMALGSTLRSVRGNLQVRPSRGVEVTREGLSLSLEPNGALDFVNGQLSVEPKRCADITARGQNLSDDDLLVVHDASRGEIRRTTLGNFYSAYINAKILHPEGPINSVQIRGRKGLNASAALTFDVRSKILNLDGEMVTDCLRVSEDAVFRGDMKSEGAVYKRIITISEEEYQVSPKDHTILVDTSANPITVLLPAASECKGRIVVLKKINSNKYKLASNLLTVKVEEGAIDFHQSLAVKHTYSSRTLQSDGVNWWLIGRTGS